MSISKKLAAAGAVGKKKHSVDVLTDRTMAGWVAPRADGSPSRLRLTMNGQDLGRITADKARRDLAQIAEGGRAGFHVKLTRGEDRYLPLLPREAVFALTDEDTGVLVCETTVEGESEGERFANQFGEEYVFYQKDGGFTIPLSSRTDDWWSSTLDALDEVFARAGEEDVPVQIGYGTLLGHVRENGFIAHDDDLDIVVHCGEQANPFDASLEFARRLKRLFGENRPVFDTNGQAHVGFNGARRVSLDFFASWTTKGRYYQNFTIAGGLAEDAVFPLQPAQFMGRSVKIASDPEAVLAAIYGPGWRDPDPAFKWNRPREVTEYFRPVHNYHRNANKDYWEGYYAKQAAKAAARPPTPPSQFAAFVTDFLEEGDTVFEFGCGNGRDSLFLARYGWDVRACDYSQAAVDANTARAEAMGADKAAFSVCNVADATDVQSFLAPATDHDRQRAAFYSRFFFHAISGAAEETLRIGLDRVARPGDLLLVETRVAEDEDRAKVTPEHFRRFVTTDEAISVWEKLGWEREYVAEGTGFAKYKQDDAYVLRFVLRKTG